MKIDVDKLAKAVADSTLSGSAMDSLAHLVQLSRVGAAAVENHKLLAAWDGKRDNKGMVDSVAAGERLHIEVQKYLTTHPEGGPHAP